MSAGASLGSPVSVSSFDSEEDGKQAAVQAERRRKMARVARTLGDGVPIELVFHQNERRRKSEEEMEKAKISLEAEEDSEPRAVTFSPSAYTWEQRSDTPSSSRPSTASAGERASVALTIRRSSSLLFKEKNIPRSATVRTEVGWTGEWNRDGTSVVKGLRALK
ncbi:hypothetical protein C8F01DRAFT_1250610 [Mycena amicta]|nr:hypothetical protein C8F01DRAFT_1250610 [Mycena amicta]